MGANTKQGWLLFLFIVGFTFLVAGLAYLGFIFAVAGLALFIVSLVGLHQIKPLEHGEVAERTAAPAGVSAPKLRVS
jgi:membrane-bound ClpP family serine protease